MYDDIIVGARRAGPPTAMLSRPPERYDLDVHPLASRRRNIPTIWQERIMNVIREVLHCKSGKVRSMVEKFRVNSSVLKEKGQEPLRLLDVTGEPYWTVGAEATVERIEDFFTMEQTLMADEIVGRAMADYHDLVERGRREIYRIEH